MKCWQIDVSAFYSSDTKLKNIFLTAIAPLVLRGLTDLKIDYQDTQAVDIQPRRLLIFDNGSRYDKSQDDEIEPGMHIHECNIRYLLLLYHFSGVFATMHLQIPVKRGFSGGKFSIFHGNQSKVFDFSLGSSEDYYYVLFSSDCSHRMLPVTGGSKVVLVCSLAWEHSRHVSRMLPTSNDRYLDTIREDVKRALANWSLPDNHLPRKLAIPLEHQYSVARLSFANLKESDRLVACLLRSIDFIDLHLAIICHSVENDSDHNKPKVTGNNRKRKKSSVLPNPPEEVITYNGERITEHWVSAVTDAPFPFTNLKIETHEIVQPDRIGASVGNIPKEWFNTGPLRHECCYHTMLVIWPSSRTLNFACRFGNNAQSYMKPDKYICVHLTGFFGALDILERLCRDNEKDGLLDEEKQRNKLLSMLGEVVAFCCSDPRHVWSLPSKDGEVTCRLLRLCINFSSIQQGLVVLNLIAQDFPGESKRSSKKFEGIPTNEVAITVAQFVRLASWDACAEFICKIVTAERLASQTEPVIRLVTSLIDHDLIEAAKEVSHRICSFIFTFLDVNNVDSKMNEAIGEMIFRLREFDDIFTSEWSKVYVKWLKKLDSQLLCELLIYLRRNLDALVMRLPHVKALYLDVCFTLVSRRFKGENLKPVTEKPLLADVLQCLIWPKNVQLVGTFIHQISQPTIGNNQALEDLVTSRFVWELCLPSLNGRLILTALVEARLKELSRLKQPVFSWSMPDAIVPNEPELESFLRSTDSNVVLPHIFSGIGEANTWAVNIFGPSFGALPSPGSSYFRTRKYSAIPKFIKVARGFACEVTKNRRLHEHNVHKYAMKKREKECLVERHRTKLIDIKEKTIVGPKVDPSLEGNSAGANLVI